ncbi:MAG: bifunctional 2-C-methyl-D-erythritol 4-phosphate cytidylyltransferase/2-C-methyl-D-erythritol 2,4-cyclodiphosphate synthase [Pseudomonadota bacterium]
MPEPIQTSSSSASNRNICVVIVAAGRGSRMGGDDGPKQYRPLGEGSVLQRTVSCFLDNESISKVQVVVHKDDHALYESSLQPHEKLLAPINGGNSRQGSVLNGLEALAKMTPQPDTVLIHDAARPFLSQEHLNRLIASADDSPNAILAVPVSDTLKRGDDFQTITETVSRSELYQAQTPQMFDFAEIYTAHQRAASEQDQEFTDDASIAEWASLPVTLVEGDPGNIKITTLLDMERAQRMIKAELTHNIPDVRTGHGYDVHQLEPGTKIRLCGVDIEHSASLKGHSDADVGLHALTDALLGTIASGDIGSHFPPSDPQWKGADSDQFLAHAISLVRESAGTVTHLDVTLVCEAPKVGPHRDAMRAGISKICDMDIARVSVKATTNEKIGFVGRSEGIAALATATVVFAK